MYKYTFVLFAFLMGALALQAQSYQTSFTYEDAPDSLKNSVFSKDGKALFDTLYLGQGASWKEYFRIYHTYYEGYSQTDAQKANATCSDVVPTIYYTDPKTDVSVNWGNRLGCGRTPRFVNDHAYWGQYGDPGEWDNRLMYSNRSDGFLLDNRRTENVTRYYGYYQVKRTRTITITQRRYKQAQRSGWILYRYSFTTPDWNIKTPTENLSVELSTTYQFWNKWGGATSQYTNANLNTWVPANYPADPESYAKEQIANYQVWKYDPADRNSTDPETVYENYPNKQVWQKRTWTITYTDYPYVWARLVTEADGSQHLDYIQDGVETAQKTPITITGANGDDFSNAYINDWTEGELNRVLNTAEYDTVAQVRHHIYLVTPRSLETGLYLPEDVKSYYDTTFYDLDYSWSGQRYVSSKPDALYHEYDTEYEVTDAIANLNSKNITETLVNNVTKGAMMVYAKQDENTYRFDHTMETSTMRAGEVRDKQIYIAGEATALCTDNGDNLGWMQPVNTDIYLENVRLQAVADNKSYQLVNENVPINNANDYNKQVVVEKSTAVFFLKEGETRFHIKGVNYLGGQICGRQNITVGTTVAGKNVDGTIFVPKYSAPIEIQDQLMYGDNSTPADVVCRLDADWCGVNEKNAYLDLSVPPISNSTYQRLNGPVYYSGYRYAPPLYTGGDHGKFIIDGGHINLWPANGHATDLLKQTSVTGADIKFEGGRYSNYLVCGACGYNFEFKENYFTISGPLAGVIKIAIFGLNMTAGSQGLGGGIAKGSLEINGGTITMNTDTNSFGYRYTVYEMVDGKNTLVQKKANNIQYGQPLLASNVKINGGTFLQPIYSITNHGVDSVRNWETPTALGLGGFTITNAPNSKNQPLVRTECALPAPNTDYSHWQEDTLKLNREGRDECMIVVNPFEDNQYIYGFTGVKSDAQSKGYFYLPSDNWKWSKNFFAKPSQPIESYEGYLPYNLTVEAGGIVNEASDTRLLGIPRYVRTFIDNEYVALCMPFKVVGISDAYGDMDAYVEEADNPHADNSNAYFYMYHMRDENGEARTTGINESFRRNYHTHAEGDYMEQGRTYLVKFPNTPGESYWSTAPVTFRGEAMDTVKGSDAFALPEEPNLDTTFVMGGNATFAEKALSGNYYVVDAANFGGDDDFHVKSNPTLAPCEGFLLGNQPTMDRFRTLGARPRPQENTPDEGTTTDSDIVEAEQGYLAVYAAEGAIHVLAEYDTEAHIYTVAGQYITTLTLQAHQPQSVSVPQGVYLVRSNEEVKKAVVD